MIDVNNNVMLFHFLYLERSFHVGKYLELEFEFRTSELNGALLSVAEPVGFPALSIEMNNGKVRSRLRFCNSFFFFFS